MGNLDRQLEVAGQALAQTLVVPFASGGPFASGAPFEVEPFVAGKKVVLAVGLEPLALLLRNIVDKVLGPYML